MESSILSMDVGDFWIWTIILAVLVVFAFFASFRFLSHSRLLADTPTSKIRSASQGYVELIGVAGLMPGPPIISPLTGTHCLWWYYRIERKVRSGKNTRWKTIDKGTSDDLFLLLDDTGECVIDPDGAKVYPSISRTWYGSSRRPVGPPPARKFNLGFGGYRYTEKMLHTRDPLYAIGEFKTQRHRPAYQDRKQEVRDLLSEWKRDKQKMGQFDVNQDGEVDVKEWEAARRVAQKQVSRIKTESAENDEIHMLGKPVVRGRPFILSTDKQNHMIRKFRWYAAGCFTFFLGGGSLLIYLLLTRNIL